MFDSIFWQQFHFMRPEWLFLLIPFSLLLVWRWRQEQQETLSKQLPEHLLKALTVGDSGWKKLLPLKLLYLIILLGVIVASGPTWQQQLSPFGEDKAPLVVVLDNSSSMQQKDLPPSRLIRAKQKIEDLLTLRSGGNTSLIVYSGSAHLAMPATQDSDVYKPLLHAIKPNIMPRKGKFAEYSLPLIDAEFKNSPTSGTVLLITDGLGSQTVQKFSDYFAHSDHQLIVFSIGNNEKLSDIPMDYTGLKRLADQSNGEIITISVDNQDIESINKQITRHMLLSLDKSLPWKDVGYYLLFPLAALFLLWFRKGWLVQWCLASMLILGSSAPNQVQAAEWHFADIWLTADQQGQWYYQQQDYLTAAERFIDPLWKGVAYYQAQEYKKAHSYFMRVDSPEALFNAANALAHQREYIAARDLYKVLIKATPDYPNANHNLNVLQKIIDDINLMSESQANTENEASRELGDAPKTSDGAEERVAKEFIMEDPLTAEQILQDEALNQRWMNRVATDPSRFLATKFQIQLNQKSATSSQIEATLSNQENN
ncbi:VWA domain-containing protein [Vibrio sp. SS-MA-C1-2]|uniref:vWA domain-containing protein n=1 Tax=Vibrio sp. SS-MA-C1-2 TaxID=2908646 RepID=UPI001F22918D|nr:VWA domain-containing protein [Vibrio sp. SS-MA-C1-2]UJF18358.1 VWA domain-containing protein [Vibrio sp. SS-MA-C1-2]